jgi:hypothetical protein
MIAGRPMKALRMAVPIALACANCDGQADYKWTTSGGNSTLDTTIPWLPAHTAASAIATKGLSGTGADNQITVTLFDVANVGDACAWAYAPTARNFTANVFDLVLLLGSRSDASRVVTPGTFSFGDLFSAVYSSFDANCRMSSPPVVATSGTVTLSSVSPSFTGAFKLTFPTGLVVGQFDAPLCATPTAAGRAVDAGSSCASYPACGAADAGSGPCFP